MQESWLLKYCVHQKQIELYLLIYGLDLKKVIELDPNKKNASANRARLLAAITAESLLLVKEKR